VGRSARRAYSYLLISNTQSLTETAERRLKAMLAATELGAGFRIAMKDLEIRGAGNILGAEQSGHIHAVGFELYTRLLSQAVEDLRARREAGESEGTDGTPSPEDAESIADSLAPEPGVSVDLGIPSSLPAEYIEDLPSRLGLYQRLIKMSEQEAIGELEDELRDRFGPLPWQAQNLLYVMRLKLEAKKAGVNSIIRENGRIVLRLSDEIGGARRVLQRRLGPAVELGNTQIRLELERLDDGWQEPVMDTLQKFAELREQMAEQLSGAVANV
jgi:transcription-repair coupling factor (superfamily II helicase)